MPMLASRYSYLAEQRIVAPGYSTMQDIIGGALAPRC
jgi:hypothetical protein